MILLGCVKNDRRVFLILERFSLAASFSRGFSSPHVG